MRRGATGCHKGSVQKRLLVGAEHSVTVGSRTWWTQNWAQSRRNELERTPPSVTLERPACVKPARSRVDPGMRTGLPVTRFKRLQALFPHVLAWVGPRGLSQQDSYAAQFP